MMTDLFCPRCGLRLWEVRTTDGVEVGRLWCRNMHHWTLTTNQSDPTDDTMTLTSG